MFEELLHCKQNNLPTQNHLIFCEHHPVYTLGKNGSMDNLLFDPSTSDADFIQIDRGGDITFHGPGQMVAYPIVDLDNFGIGTAVFVELLEQAVIDLLSQYSINSERLPNAAGIWVNTQTQPQKICAVGIKVSKHITMHGIALNINTDLGWFDKIVPCGLKNLGVTSMQTQKGVSLDLKEIEKKFIEVISSKLDATLY